MPSLHATEENKAAVGFHVEISSQLGQILNGTKYSHQSCNALTVCSRLRTWISKTIRRKVHPRDTSHLEATGGDFKESEFQLKDQAE